MDVGQAQPQSGIGRAGEAAAEGDQTDRGKAKKEETSSGPDDEPNGQMPVGT